MDRGTDELKIFRQTEEFLERRRGKDNYAEFADYAIRFCQAIVASFAKYNARNEWSDLILNSKANSIYLYILRDLEKLRKSSTADGMTYIHAVNECQYRIAKHLHMYDWREQLHLEHLKTGEHILHLPWHSGSVNDCIIAAGKEMGISHRYDGYFRLELCINGTWGRADSKCENGVIDVYFFPNKIEGNDAAA